MKKIRSNSKRKWIIGGVMAFGSIALVTTGFATWVIGTTILEDNDNKVGITVDTAINNSVTLTATLTEHEAFYLGEENLNDSENLVNVTNGKASDFSVVFTKVVIECGKQYHTDHFAGKNFVLTLGEDGLSDYSANTVSESLIDTAGTPSSIRSGSSWKYIDTADKAVTFVPKTEGVSDWADKNGIMTCEITNATFTFGWGDFFGKAGPASFYNTNKTTIKGSLAKVQAVEAELTAMHDALDTQNFNFLLKLTDGTSL